MAKITVPLAAGAAIDEGFSPYDSSVILKWCGLIVALSVVAAVCAGFRWYSAFYVAHRTEHVLRSQLFSHLQQLHFGYHDRAQIGNLMARANLDLRQINQLVVFTPVLAANVVMVIGILAVLFTLNVKLTLLSIITFPLLVVGAVWFQRLLNPVAVRLQERLAQVSEVVEEGVAGVRVVKGLGAEEVETRRLDDRAEQVRSEAVALGKLRATFNPMLDLLPMVALVTVLYVGGKDAIDGVLTVGDLVAFSALLLQLVFPLRMTSYVVAQVARASASAARVQEVMVTEPEIVEDESLPSLPPGPGAVSFSGVRFAYHGGRDVLVDFDLELEGGESVALVGPTGCGKSTVARSDPALLRRDGGSRPHRRRRRALASGSDRSAARSVWCSRTRSCSATPCGRTSRSRRARPRTRGGGGAPRSTPPRSSVRRDLAGADDFIRELPDGYDTMLGEHGFSLSGGQRQRLAIARAILADPRVLILDDATSAVDPTKEHEIRAALAEVMRGRTTLIIAHRPATIALADRVVLMDEHGPRRGDRHARPSARDERGLPTRARRRLQEPRGRPMTAPSAAPDVDVDEVDVDVDHRRRRPARTRPTSGGGHSGCCGRGDGSWWRCRCSSWVRPRLMTAGPALISFGIDEGVSKGDVDTVTLASVLFIAAAAGAYVFGRAAIYGVSKVGEAFLLDLRRRVFHHVMGMSMGFFDRTRTGLLVSRMTADVEALQDLISQGLAVFVVSAVLVIGTLVAMFLLSWQLGVVVLLMSPILVVATVWYRRMSSRAYLRVRDRVGGTLTALQEGLAGVRVIQAFDQTERTVGDFIDTSREQYRTSIGAERITATYNGIIHARPRSDARADRRPRRATSPPTAPSPSASSRRSCCTSTTSTSRSSSSRRSSTRSSRRRPRCTSSTGCSTRRSTSSSPTSRSTLPATGDLVVDHVGFRYAPELPPVLRDVSLVLESGRRLVLVGPTGAGKSTLAKLMARFYDPTEGTITFGGVDLRRRRRGDVAERDRRDPPGGVPLHRDDPRQPPARSAGRDRGSNPRRARPSRPRRTVRSLSRRPRHSGRDARHELLGRRAPARVGCARRARRSVGARPRRGDVEPRPRHRAPPRPGTGAPDGGPQRRGDRAPPHDRGAR